MLHLIVVLVFCIIICIIMIKLCDGEIFSGIFLSMLIIVGLIIVNQVILESDSELLDNSYETYNIYTLRDNSYESQDGFIAGSVFFIYGQTNTEKGLVYTIMFGDEVSGYLVKSLDASNTYLFMDGGDSPYIKYTYKNELYKSNWFSRFFYMYDYEKQDLIKVELHVPKEAIVVSYSIDLE